MHSRVARALPTLALLAIPAALAAQDVSVRAYLTPGASVGVGRPFVLNLEIGGSQRIDSDPEIPELGDLATYLGSSTSSSMQMVGGRTTVSLTIQYRYQALQQGTRTIPAIEVRVGGRTYRTEPLELTVSGTAPPARGGSQPDQGSVVGPEDLFVTAEPSSRSVLAGEPFTVEYRLWTRVDVGGYSLTHVPEPEGFWVEELDSPSQPVIEQMERNGRQYTTAVIRRLALVPTGSGERTLDPLGLEARVRVRRRSNDPFDRFFGGSLFGNSEVPTTVLSDPVTVTVRPLPPGRPEPFSGVVGSLELTASLDRDTVDANEAVTLTVRASGEGNVSAIPPPEIAFPSDFEVFPPEISESVGRSSSGLGGSKTFEYVVIPRAPGSRTIPRVSMGYYDRAAGSYRTASVDPLPLTVTGEAVGGPASLARGGVATLRQDIRFIRLGSPRFVRTDRVLFQAPAFWLVMLLPMVGVVGAVGTRRHQDRLEGDVAWARGRRAGRVAKKRLAEARRLAGGSDSRAFYAEVARALRGYVADKLNVSEAGMRTAELQRALDGRSVPEETVSAVIECLEQCDRQRFAPPEADTVEHTRMVERAGELMTALEKVLRR